MANNAPSLELVNEILKRLGKRSRVVRHERSSTSVPRWQLFDGDMVHFYETAGGKTLVVLVNHAENGNYVKQSRSRSTRSTRCKSTQTERLVITLVCYSKQTTNRSTSSTDRLGAG